MTKNLSITVFVLFLILTFTSSCSLIPHLIPAPMSPVEAADLLMTALRDGNYALALELIENDGGKPTAGSIDGLKRKIESENLQPQSWTLEVKHVSESKNNSYEIVTGKVIFKDGSSGTMRSEARAWGLKKNPWRFSGFELKR